MYRTKKMRCILIKTSIIALMILIFSQVGFSQSLPQLSGLAFGDYYYNVKNHSAASKDMQAFDYRRIFITVDDSLSAGVTGRFRLESDPTTTTLANNRLSVAVKDAYLNWSKVLCGSDVRFGIQPTPAVESADAIFGYRSLEKSMEDLHSISSTRDLGLAVRSSYSGSMSSVLMVGDNSNNALWSNRYKRFYGQFSIKPITGLVAVASVDYAGAAAEKYLRTGDIIINYSTTAYSIGAQAYIQDIDHNAYLSGKATGGTSETYGFGVDGWISIANNLRFVARYDYWNPNNAYNDVATNPLSNKWNLVIAGLDYSYSNNIHIMPNVEGVSYGLPGTGSDVTARVTLYLTF